MLNVIEFLRNHSLEELTQQFAIRITRHQTYPNLISLKYDQLSSLVTHPIVRECRGLILDESNHWQIVAMPYLRFFNYREKSADAIDWSTAQCFSKLDGCLTILYHYNNQWQVATSSTPDASGQAGTFKITFEKLFWKVWQELGYQLPTDTDTCYLFELMTPYNRVVVRHDTNRLVLHGARNRLTLQEYLPTEIAAQYGWESCPVFPLNSLDAILKAAEALEATEAEGYVVCDRNFSRIKVKAPAYVAMSYLKDGFSVQKLLEVIRSNEGEEFLAYFPEWRELYTKVQHSYQALIGQAEQVYEQVKDIPQQKDFALAVQPYPFAGVLFSMRTGQTASIQEGFKGMTLGKLERLLNVKKLA